MVGKRKNRWKGKISASGWGSRKHRRDYMKIPGDENIERKDKVTEEDVVSPTPKCWGK